AESECQIGNGTSQTAVGAERKPAKCRLWIWHAAERRTESNYVAEGGRIAQRAGHIRPARHGNHATGERNGRSTGRATTGLADVIGIACCAEHRIEGLRARSELGRVGLADNDRAGPAHAVDEQVVLCGDVVFVNAGAEGGSYAS